MAWLSALAYRCCRGSGTDATLEGQGRAAQEGGSDGERKLTQCLAVRPDLTDMDPGFSHEKVLRTLQLRGGVGIPSH